MNARESDGEGDSPATDKESEDDDGNCWWFRSRDSQMLPAPFFYELDALINRVTLKKVNVKTHKKKGEKDRNNTQNFLVSHDIPHFLLCILQRPYRLSPFIHTQRISFKALVDGEPATT